MIHRTQITCLISLHLTKRHCNVHDILCFPMKPLSINIFYLCPFHLWYISRQKNQNKLRRHPYQSWHSLHWETEIDASEDREVGIGLEIKLACFIARRIYPSTSHLVCLSNIPCIFRDRRIAKSLLDVQLGFQGGTATWPMLWEVVRYALTCCCWNET